MPTDEHKQLAEKKGAISVAVITVSDTRTVETDSSGALIRELLGQAGHTITDYQIIKDEPEQINAVLDAVGDAQAIIFNGGTGIAPRDTTFDALSSKLEKTLPGFGEIFRMLSYHEIGSAAMLSRAVAGTYQGKIIFSTPGSTNAVRLAMEKLILPEIQHLVWELSGKPT